MLDLTREEIEAAQRRARYIETPWPLYQQDAITLADQALRQMEEIERLRAERTADFALMAETVEAQKLGLAAIEKLSADLAAARAAIDRVLALAHRMERTADHRQVRGNPWDSIRAALRGEGAKDA